MDSFNLKKEQYDAIIVGGGIGGLVCGCYLAQAGMKVLILEKNNKPGGYCISFEKSGFLFDGGVHGIGGIYDGGKTLQMLNDLSIDLRWETRDPCESVYLKDRYLINFWRDLNRTKEEINLYFPSEKQNFIAFLKLVLDTSPLVLFRKYCGKSFNEVLDDFFTNEDLKTILKAPCGNIGVSSHDASALSMFSLYKEFLLNPHCYPAGGMSIFAEKLKDKFAAVNGCFFSSSKVESISKANSQYSVVTNRGEEFISRLVIFNIDPYQIMQIDRNVRLSDRFSKIMNLPIAPSAYFVNWGFENKQKISLNKIGINNLWYFPIDDTSLVYPGNDDQDFADNYLLSKSVFTSLASCQTIRALILAPFFSVSHWQKNKQILLDNITKRMTPFIDGAIGMKKISAITIPADLYNLTLNHEGSCYGWKPTNALHNFYRSFMNLGNNLYLCGHWVPSIFGGGGITSVINSGMNCAKFIIKSK